MLAFIASHSLPLVLTSVAVCVTMATILVVLFARADAVSGPRKRLWLSLIGFVAGIGVWTTHFVAMIGFRPDVLFGYDATLTFISLAIGIVCVGGPLAAVAWLQRRWLRTAAGATAGLGVGAMHFSGMSALQGCVASYDTPTTIVALAAGSLAIGLAAFVGWRGLRRVAMAVLLVLGVAVLHFTSMAGVTLTETPGADFWTLDPLLLSVFVSTSAFLLLIAAVAIAVGAAKLDEKSEAEAVERAAHLERLSTALQNMSNGIVKVSAQRTIELFNAQVECLFRLEPGHLKEGMTLNAFLASIAAANGYDADNLAGAIADHERWINADRVSRDERSFQGGRIISVACKPLPGGGGVLTYHDVTAHRTIQAEMAYMAYHDALTGLPNRRKFTEQMTVQLATGEPAAILMLDLDHFKLVNDTLGHGIGDQLLTVVASRLRDVLGPADNVFRLGGDEMAILPHAVATAPDIARRIVRELGASYEIDGHAIRIGCSVGLTPPLTGESVDTLIQKADLALYEAKKRGRGRWAVYEDGMMEAAQHRREMEEELREAIAENEFELVYQPLYQLPEQVLTGFEALIRWKHKAKGTISPADFIPLAEDNGMIGAIGAWVLDEACRTLSELPDHLHVAVNVSPVQMRTADMLRQVVKCLERHRVPPSRLEIELTETAMVEDAGEIALTLRGLRALGIKVAMDDFGTGYSSLAHLRTFELDRIKIDRSFVDSSADDIGAQAVLKAVTAMARELSIPTIGEGVESPEQLERLILLGCDAAQGFLLGKPASKLDIMELARSVLPSGGMAASEIPGTALVVRSIA